MSPTKKNTALSKHQTSFGIWPCFFWYRKWHRSRGKGQRMLYLQPGKNDSALKPSDSNLQNKLIAPNRNRAESPFYIVLSCLKGKHLHTASLKWIKATMRTYKPSASFLMKPVTIIVYSWTPGVMCICCNERINASLRMLKENVCFFYRWLIINTIK